MGEIFEEKYSKICEKYTSDWKNEESESSSIDARDPAQRIERIAINRNNLRLVKLARAIVNWV